MKTDAQIHAEEDRQKKETIESKNAADALVYTGEKALRDAADKTPPDIKKNIEEKIEALKKAKEGSDVNAIRTASEDLSREMQKIGEILYKQGQEPKDNNIKDADFKEEDGGDNKS